MFFDGWQGIWRTALVGVLAYLAQIEAGVLSLDPEPLDLRDIVAGATLPFSR